MDLAKLGRNVLFSIAIGVLVFAMSKANLPATHRVEEYIAWVLSTEFDYRGWIAERDGGLASRLFAWSGRFTGSRGANPRPPASPAVSPATASPESPAASHSTPPAAGGS